MLLNRNWRPCTVLGDLSIKLKEMVRDSPDCSSRVDST